MSPLCQQAVWGIYVILAIVNMILSAWSKGVFLYLAFTGFMIISVLFSARYWHSWMEDESI